MNYLFPLDEPESISEKRDALCSQQGVKETDEIADLQFCLFLTRGAWYKPHGVSSNKRNVWDHVVSDQEQTRAKIQKEVYLHMFEIFH
jgi:hypothetical protein